MDSCIFCKIINNELPSAKVYEDNDFIAILDLFPVAEGHTLLIPKCHCTNIFDTPENISSLIYPHLQKLSNAISIATGCSGINIVQNNGAASGQIVFHSHLHIIPRNDGDNIKVAIAGKKQATAEELKITAGKVVKFIKE